MPRALSRVKVAVLLADGFEQVEFDKPVTALRKAGAIVEVLAQDEEHLRHIRGMHHLEAAEGTEGDRLIEKAKVRDYDALLLPGGAISPDTMRQSEEHLDFVEEFVGSGKPVFAICHAGWLLADAGVAQGRRLTSWEGIRYDLERAGAEWVNEPVVIDGNLITSRKPADLPKFITAIKEMLANPPTPARAPAKRSAPARRRSTATA